MFIVVVARWCETYSTNTKSGTAGYVITSRQLMRDDDNNNNDDDGLKEKLPSLVVVAYVIVLLYQSRQLIVDILSQRSLIST